MDELIIRVLRGQATEDEERQVRVWRAADPSNEAEYRAARQVWETATVDRLTAGAPPRPTTESVTGPSRAGRSAARVPAAAAVATRRWAPLAAAAVLVLAVGFSARWWWAERAGMVEYAAVLDARTVDLADGSVVRLAPGSRLRVRLRADRRDVEFQGHAFFAVAPDSARPFVIDAGVASVEVVGTRFDLVARDRRAELSLVEGRVHFSSAGRLVTLSAGQRIRTGDDGLPVVEAPEDVLASLDWPDPPLIFQSTPLSDVAVEVSRRFERPVLVAPDLADRTVTIWFDDERFAEVAEALCAITNARCELAGDTLRIRP